MNTTELMIGDWVEVVLNSKKHFAQVQMIDGYGDNATSNECVCDAIYYSIDELKPIPLTPEILKKNGFEQTGDSTFSISDNGITFTAIWLSKTMFNVGFYRRDNNSPNEHFSLNVRYVHELQHILRLCGIGVADNFTHAATS